LCRTSSQQNEQTVCYRLELLRRLGRASLDRFVRYSNLNRAQCQWVLCVAMDGLENEDAATSFTLTTSRSEEVTIAVQTGNLTVPPTQENYRSSWKVTQEWKIKASTGLTAEGCVPQTTTGWTVSTRRDRGCLAPSRAALVCTRHHVSSELSRLTRSNRLTEVVSKAVGKKLWPHDLR
jgi:hypothetical protein